MSKLAQLLDYQMVFRCVFITHLSVKEIAKVAMISKEFNRTIDSNNYKKTDLPNSVHFEMLVKAQSNISSDTLDKIKECMIAFEEDSTVWEKP